MTGVVETNAHCDIIAARAEAAVAAVEIVTNADPAEIPDFQIAVRDESGKVLFEAVPKLLRGPSRFPHINGCARRAEKRYRAR